MQQRAFGAVPLKLRNVAVVGETKLAYIDHVYIDEIDWVWREIPRLNLKLAHLDLFNVANAGNLGLVLCHGARGPQLLNLIFAREGLIRHSLGSGGCILHVDEVQFFIFRLGRRPISYFGGDK